MDPDTLLIIAAIPFYTISTVVVAKYAWMTFQSQAQEQTTETATVPGKVNLHIFYPLLFCIANGSLPFETGLIMASVLIRQPPV